MSIQLILAFLKQLTCEFYPKISQGAKSEALLCCFPSIALSLHNPLLECGGAMQQRVVRPYPVPGTLLLTFEQCSKPSLKRTLAASLRETVQRGCRTRGRTCLPLFPSPRVPSPFEVNPPPVNLYQLGYRLRCTFQPAALPDRHFSIPEFP